MKICFRAATAPLRLAPARRALHTFAGAPSRRSTLLLSPLCLPQATSITRASINAAATNGTPTPQRGHGRAKNGGIRWRHAARLGRGAQPRAGRGAAFCAFLSDNKQRHSTKIAIAREAARCVLPPAAHYYLPTLRSYAAPLRGNSPAYSRRFQCRSPGFLLLAASSASVCGFVLKQQAFLFWTFL